MNTLGNRTLNLLIVDDDESMVRLLTEVIRMRLGDRFSVTGLSNSAEASDWLEDNCCDVLLSDIEMPGIDGAEMLRRAKARNAWTQVIFITGQSTLNRIADAIADGASDYLVKPIDTMEVVGVLEQQYTRIQRWISAARGTLATSRH